mmetsp:Transcript_517/g.1484  ORF Transcript_517/g.1484 Transcript_517/m.1484 type:complete len:808 (+) Transcript_517:120-2543(+)
MINDPRHINDEIEIKMVKKDNGRKRNAKKTVRLYFILELSLFAYALIQLRTVFVHSDIAFNDMVDYEAISVATRRLSSLSSEPTLDQEVQGAQPPMNSLLPVESSPLRAWKHMMQDWNVHSVVEMGACGTATTWFAKHNATPVQCVAPMNQEWSGEWQIPHDIANQGPWKPVRTFDAVWAMDLLEQIPLNQATIYQSTFQSTAAIIIVKIPQSYVEQVWVDSMAQVGFPYSDALTSQLRQWAQEEEEEGHDWLASSLVVLLNPMVASLAEHSHLFMEHGCYGGRILAKDRKASTDPAFRRRECGVGKYPGAQHESSLPEEFRPIPLTAEMDHEWLNFMETQIGGLSLPHEQIHQRHARIQQHATYVSRLQFGKDPYPVPVEPFHGFWDIIWSRARNKSLVPDIMIRIQNHNFSDLPPVSTLLFPSYKAGVQTAEHKHLGKNGVEESTFLNAITDDKDFSDENLVWVADPGWGWSWNTWCQNLANAVRTTIVLRYEAKVNTRWPIFIVDFSDGAGRQRCLDVESLVGIDLVSYSARSITRNRGWLPLEEWVQFGYKVTKPEDYSYLKNVPRSVQGEKHYHHTPLPVRTDTVSEFRSVLNSNHKIGLPHPIEKLRRPTDVSHIWPLSNSTGLEHGVQQKYGRFRNRVSQLIHEYGQELGWTTSIEVKGKGIKAGRHGVHVDYIEALLETKILVVTQRDAWEDHYRLMEALVSGACVFSDFMFGLPAGLQNGTSIVLFKTKDELKSLISYYLGHDAERLDIARRGREVAFSKHRSWQRMEEVVFGKILTESKCPYIVHSKDSCTVDKALH